jgi:hypothetical protein
VAKDICKYCCVIDPLLGNDRETSNETTAVARQRPERQWTGWKALFSVRSALMATHTTMSGIFYAVRAEGLQAGQSLELSHLWVIRQTVNQ